MVRKIMDVLVTETYESQVDFPPDVKGWRPLHYAAARGNPDTVRMLLEHGANPNVKNTKGQTPLHMAVSNWAGPEVLLMLLRAGARLWARDIDGLSVTDYVEPGRRWDLVVALIEHNVMFRDNPGIAPSIHCKNRKLRDLLQAGMQQAHKDQSLFFASCDKVARLLIKYGADVNTRDERNAVPLHYIQDPDTVSLLIKKGADVNAVNDAGNTPLHTVKNPDVARVLLDRGADPDIKNPDGLTPLDTCGDPDIAVVLIDAGAKLDFYDGRNATVHIHTKTSPGNYAVYSIAVKQADFPELLDDEEFKKRECQNLVLSLVEDNNLPAMDFLCVYGLDVGFDIGDISLADFAREIDASDELVDTLEYFRDHLYPEVYENEDELCECYYLVDDCMELVRHILDADDATSSMVSLIINNPVFDCRRRNEKGGTVYHMIAERFDFEAITGMDWHRLDDYRTPAGKTPLHTLMLAERQATLENGSEGWWNITAADMVSAMSGPETGGCDPNAKDNFGNTPLFFAASAETAQALIDAGADVNATNKRQDTPLFYTSFPEVAKLLIKSGADVEYINGLGYTAWMTNKNEDIRKLLLDAGAVPKESPENPYAFTPLHDYQLDLEEAKKLISGGADIEARSLNGYTPLHIAVLWDNLALATLLIESGANVDAGT